MSEILNTFLLDDPETPIPMDRDKFYAEQVNIFQKTGKPTRACEIVDVFIFNSHGQLFMQKRSYHKAHNPGILDKSIGGHVRHTDTPDYTVMVETVQELQTPSIVLKNDRAAVGLFDYGGNYQTRIEQNNIARKNNRRKTSHHRQQDTCLFRALRWKYPHR